MTGRSLAYVAAAIALFGLLSANAHGLRRTSVTAGGPSTEDGFYALAVAREASLGHQSSIPGGATATPTDGVQPKPSAVAARSRGALPAFVRASAIDVVVDWPAYADDALGAEHLGFHERARFGDEYAVGVREGREHCLTT